MARAVKPSGVAWFGRDSGRNRLLALEHGLAGPAGGEP